MICTADLGFLPRGRVYLRRLSPKLESQHQHRRKTPPSLDVCCDSTVPTADGDPRRLGVGVGRSGGFPLSLHPSLSGPEGPKGFWPPNYTPDDTYTFQCFRVEFPKGQSQASFNERPVGRFAAGVPLGLHRQDAPPEGMEATCSRSVSCCLGDMHSLISETLRYGPVSRCFTWANTPHRDVILDVNASKIDCKIDMLCCECFTSIFTKNENLGSY